MSVGGTIVLPPADVAFAADASQSVT